MNKLLKRLFVIAMAVILAFSCVGCNTKEDGENMLEIYIFEQGYGVKWVEEIGNAFKEEDWVKEKYSDIQIKITDNRTDEFGQNQLKLGEGKNTFDLLFTAFVADYYGTKELLDLTDVVYNEKVPGEDITYSDKLNDSVKSNYTFIDKADGSEHYYATPWQGGMCTILYNKTKLDAMQLEEPRTTDEMFAVMDAYKSVTDSKGKPGRAILQSKDTNYTDVFLSSWWAQYEGIQGYENFYNGIDKDGELSKKIFEYEGRLEALKIMERLFSVKNEYVDNNSFNNDFMASQTSFIEGQAGLFHFNGDWFSQEMAVTIDLLKQQNKNVDEIKILKTPIISSIINVCPKKSIADDKELSALVKAIDAGSTALKGEGYEVEQADYDKIKEARFIVNGVSANTMGVIPSYALGKDIAVDFLRYMATDKALEIYTKATYGATIDFDFNLKEYSMDTYNALPELNKQRIDYYNSELSEVHVLRPAGAFPLSAFGNVQVFISTKYFQTFTNPDNTKTPQDIYDDTLSYWSDTQWKNAVTSAGI